MSNQANPGQNRSNQAPEQPMSEKANTPSRQQDVSQPSPGSGSQQSGKTGQQSKLEKKEEWVESISPASTQQTSPDALR
jgi:hypothetical protein